MSDEPDQRPEGALIAEALARHVPKISQRAAARRAEISETRWRQIVQGYQQLANGVRAPVSAPAETLARMAAAVDVTADDLRRVGRDDAALILEAKQTVPSRAPDRHGHRLPPRPDEITVESEESLRYLLARLEMQEERVAASAKQLDESRDILAQMQAMVANAETAYRNELARLAEMQHLFGEFQRRHLERRSKQGDD